MLRLGIWQLDRAQQKSDVLDQVKTRSELPSVDLNSLITSFHQDLRFKNVTAHGRYLADKSIYIDNQVVAGQVGYRVFTPFLVNGTDTVIMVDRGWISVGESRARLPKFDTQSSILSIVGRLNTPPAQPPLWDAKYSVSNGAVWQYLPLREYATQMQLMVLPLVLELAPEASDPEFKIVRAEINDEWVAKHHAYAFQWFTMALAFTIACLVLLLRLKRTSHKRMTED